MRNTRYDWEERRALLGYRLIRCDREAATRAHYSNAASGSGVRDKDAQKPGKRRVGREGYYGYSEPHLQEWYLQGERSIRILQH